MIVTYRMVVIGAIQEPDTPVDVVLECRTATLTFEARMTPSKYIPVSEPLLAALKSGEPIMIGTVTEEHMKEVDGVSYPFPVMYRIVSVRRVYE